MWWTALLGLVDPVSRVAEQIAKAKVASLDATTQQERIAADERVRTLEARRDVLLANAANRIDTWTRAGLASPVIVIMWKILVWDKALGQWTRGHTDPLDVNLWWFISVVVAFYFLASAVTIARRK